MPTNQNTAEDMDNLDDLLQYISYSSPECLEDLNKPLNAVSTSTFLDGETESEVIASVLNQRNLEQLKSCMVQNLFGQKNQQSFWDSNPGVQLSGNSTGKS